MFFGFYTNCNLTCRVRVVFLFSFLFLAWTGMFIIHSLSAILCNFHALRMGYLSREARSSSSIACRNFDEEMKRPGVWESDQGSSYHQDNLASLYRPPSHLMLHGSFEKVHVHDWSYGPRVFSCLCIAIYVQDLYTEVVDIMDFVPFLLPYSLQVISNVGFKMIIYLIYFFNFF